MKARSNNKSNSKQPNIQSHLIIGSIIIALIMLILGGSYYTDVRKIDKKITSILDQSFESNDSISPDESMINTDKSYQQILEITKSANRKTILLVLFALVLITLTFIWLVFSLNKTLAKIILRSNNLSDEDILKKLPDKTKTKFANFNYPVLISVVKIVRITLAEKRPKLNQNLNPSYNYRLLRLTTFLNLNQA